jgi:membrane-bound ClpP family serine protease
MTGKEGPSTLKTWLIVLVALIDDVAALALVFIVLWLLDIRLSLVAIIIIGLALGTIIFFLHRAIVPSLRRRKVTGTEGMIGTVCEVTETLAPKGCVKVNSEYWKARSVGGDIGVGEEVEIVAVKGLTLEVRQRET